MLSQQRRMKETSKALKFYSDQRQSCRSQTSVPMRQTSPTQTESNWKRLISSISNCPSVTLQSKSRSSLLCGQAVRLMRLLPGGHTSGFSGGTTTAKMILRLVSLISWQQLLITFGRSSEQWKYLKVAQVKAICPKAFSKTSFPWPSTSTQKISQLPWGCAPPFPTSPAPLAISSVLCASIYNHWLTIISNMSEQLQMSGESSMDRNFQIRTNNQGENELYIPCWEEEGSNSTQYHHLIEQTKFFKNKCKHLENHLEENHREFSSLNQLYLIAEANERRLLKDNEDLKRHNRDLMVELSQVKAARDANANELYASAKRESELREKLFKNREREGELVGQLEALRAECEGLRRKGAQGGEEERWKRYYNDQVAKVEQQWKAAYDELQGQFDRKSKELREKQEQLKIFNKNCNAHKEDYQLRIKGLQSELDETRRQSAKFKAQASDSQRQIKELKLVRDDVSAKNDQIQSENSRLKKSQKEEAAKYMRLASEHQELQLAHEDLTARHTLLGGQTNNLKSALNELRLRLTSLEKQLGEVKNDRDSAIMGKNYVENANVALQQDFSLFKKQKQVEMGNLKGTYQGMLRDVKEAANQQNTLLQNSISALRQEIQALKAEKRQGAKLDSAASERIVQLQAENASLKDEILNWRGRYDRLNAQQQQQQSPKQCNHEAELSELKQEALAWRSKHDKLREHVSGVQDENNDLKRRLNEAKDQAKTSSTKLLREIDELTIKFQNMIDENERLTREKKKLTDQKQKLISERNKLLTENEELEREKSDFLNERRQLLSEKKTAAGENEADTARFRSLQLKLREKSSEIQRFESRVKQLQQELQSIRSRPKDQAQRQRPEKEKLKRFQLRLKEKQQELRELQERVEQLQNQYQSQRAKSKALEKDSKAKDNQLNKRDRKIKELQSSLEEMQSQLQSLEAANEKSKNTIDSLKKQLKSEQNTSERLRTQIQRQDSEKENWQNQEKNISNSAKLHEKERKQLEEQLRRVTIELQSKEQEIIELKRQIQIIKESSKLAEPIKPDTNFTQEIDALRSRVRDLQQQLRQKQDTIKRLQNSSRKDDDVPSGTLQQLQAEYNRQLIALKRLIMYKGYRQEQIRRVDELKADYQGKIQGMLADYRSMQQEMLILREKVIAQRIAMPPESSLQVEQVWRVRLEHISEERQVLIQKVAMWERKYEQLRFLFEAKLESKEETINLLNLKLSNLEMARPHCQYSCQHR